MKLTLVLLLFFSLSGIPDIEQIRTKYKKAIDSEPETEAGLKLLETVSKKEPLFYAYKGAFTALLAKHASNPYTKLEKVKQASAILDEAVTADAAHTEIRYLRYAMEKNIPSFLPYREHIGQDEAKIVAALTKKTDGLSPELKKEIAAFMLKNAQLEPDEKKILESLTR